MHLHITTIIFLIFEHINKVFTQGVPISPCPKIFQYRFDGSEWFGILSVRNPDFGQPLNLRVTLSMRGKPVTNYLGEIELLTRGQFLTDAPVLYKIKFPKSNFPPKLLQITTNNQVICLGAADHGIFVTQIQLEHTRKFSFLPEDIPPPKQSSSISSSSFLPVTAGMSLSGGNSATGMKEVSMLPTNIEFDTKHLPLTDTEKNPLRRRKDFCGTTDERIRFQVLHALKEAKAANAAFRNSAHPSGVMSKSSKIPMRSSEKDEAEIQPPLVTSDTDLNSDPTFDNELPSITRGAWPWLAAVYVNNLTSLSYHCGGTLVSTRVVVSAAHCFQLLNQRYTANEVLVFLGRHNLKNWNEEGSLAAPVDDIFIHPDFNQNLNSYDADIAVVILRNEVRFNTFIRPACLWSGSTNKDYIDGEHGIVVGWGLGGFNSSKQSPFTSSVPKIISTPIVSNEVCYQANSKYESLSSNRTFCAGIIFQQQSKKEPKGGFEEKPLNIKHRLSQGPCTGDSGTGLLIFKNNRWMLRGTVSGLLPLQKTGDDSAASESSQSCSTNQYVIYTDVAKFLDWIFAFLL